MAYTLPLDREGSISSGDPRQERHFPYQFDGFSSGRRSEALRFPFSGRTFASLRFLGRETDPYTFYDSWPAIWGAANAASACLRRVARCTA
jgi:hypothetical protein